MRPTIYDVAKAAGTSAATVSKVINNRGKISQGTRERVKQVMKEFGFEPSTFAVALNVKRTFTIGLMIPNLANPFFAEIARKIEDRAYEKGYSIFMCSTDNEEKKEEQYVKTLRKHTVDGIIIASAFNDLSSLQTLLSEHMPIVVIAQDIPDSNLLTVAVDDYKGGYEAGLYLLEKNHSRIGIVGEPLRSSYDRIRGFKDVLMKNGLPFNKDQQQFISTEEEAASVERLKAFLSSERFSAIVACNDLLAMKVLQAAQQLNVVVPDDLSIISFDNTILGRSSVPPLTTYAQPFEEMGKEVVDQLISVIEKNKEKQPTPTYNLTLVERNSVAVYQKKE